jgi:type I restriction enzyme S subunit
VTYVDTPLAEIADLIRGITFPASAKHSSSGVGLVPCLRTLNVQATVTYDDLIYVPVEYVRSDVQHLRRGDILVSMSNSLELVGKCALVGDVPERATFGGFIAALRPRPGVDHSYVFQAMRDSRFRAYIRSIASTTTNISNINASKLLGAKIPLVGRNEQRRIVSKIDELFSRIDEGEQALQRVTKLVERYHRSVLKAAVTGELTRDWRESRKRAGEPVESGEALLARILEARRVAWEQAELAKLKSKGKAPTDDHWKLKYQEPAPPDVTDLPKLPGGWVWASMDQIGVVSGGLTKNQRRRECETRRPYLRVANVYANRLDLEDVQTIGIGDNELDRVLLEKGDLLVVEGNGSIEQIGRVAIWDGSIAGCVHQNNIIKVRCTELLPSWYVLIWCLSPHGRGHIQRVASSTAGLHTLSLSKVESLPVPVPTSGELALIRDRFDQTSATILSQRQQLSRSLTTSSALGRSILKAAFSGQLVPQDPNDEPASKLLERIAGERASAATPRRPIKKTA